MKFFRLILCLSFIAILPISAQLNPVFNAFIKEIETDYQEGCKEMKVQYSSDSDSYEKGVKSLEEARFTALLIFKKHCEYHLSYAKVMCDVKFNQDKLAEKYDSDYVRYLDHCKNKRNTEIKFLPAYSKERERYIHDDFFLKFLESADLQMRKKATYKDKSVLKLNEKYFLVLHIACMKEHIIALETIAARFIVRNRSKSDPVMMKPQVNYDIKGNLSKSAQKIKYEGSHLYFKNLLKVKIDENYFHLKQ